jgi:DNA-binding SARP family transcriptional activator
MVSDQMKVYSLGYFYLANGQNTLYPRDWRSKKALQIFKYLLIHKQRFVSSETLLDLFWSDDDDNTRHALHNTIYNIRSTLYKAFPQLKGESIIIFQDGSYTLDTKFKFWWDVEEFLSLLKTAETLEDNDALQLYKAAFELYNGPFLLDDVMYYWTDCLRNNLADRYREAIIRCSNIMLKTQKGHTAITLLKEAINDAPLNEALRGALMKALIAEGQIGQAIYEFIEIKTLLRDELGIDPGPSLMDVYKQALDEGTIRSVEAFSEGEKYPGALSCSIENFRSMLERELRAFERYGTSITILKLSLAEYEVIAEKVMMSVVNNLRAADVVSITGQDDIVILLYNVDKSDVGDIVKRISKTVAKEVNLEQDEDFSEISVIKVDKSNEMSREELIKKLVL